jgi:hypothetical protein
LARRYLPPILLSRIPVDLVPTARMGELIDLVVAQCDEVLTNDGAIHPTLIKVLAEEAAAKLLGVDDESPES